MHELADRFYSYITATWHYRWYGVIAAWVVGIAGWTAVALMPDRYQASARVYVDTQSILRPLLAGLAMQPNVTQIVEMMSRTLISRPNVEKVIGMSQMNAKLKAEEDPERLITRMTRELSIKSTGSQNLYTIAFADNDPQQAKRVVESLLTIFEQNLGDKRKDSDSAQSFIEDQLKLNGDRLRAAENAVTDFKRRNLGLMPGQGENFYSRLGEAKIALNQARLELAEAEQGRDAIKRRFAGEAPPSLLDERVETEGPTPAAANPELDIRIQSLQQKLDTLRLTYTDQHPDIAAILPMIERLKAQKQSEWEQKQREAKAKKPLPTATKTRDPLYQQLTISMAEYDATVASLKARVGEYERRYSELKAAANAIPQVEAQYTQLTRDYEVTKKNYDQLATRREAAQLTGDVQTNVSTMEFRVIDPPQVSTTPDWPNRPVFNSLVLLVAIGGGIAIAFLISQLRPTINSERSLREVSGLAVFGTVAMAWTGEQKQRKKAGLIALTLCMVGLLTVYVAMMAAPISQRIMGVEIFSHR